MPGWPSLRKIIKIPDKDVLDEAQTIVLTFDIHFHSLMRAILDYLEKIQSVGFGSIITLSLVIKIPYPKSIMGEEI